MDSDSSPSADVAPLCYNKHRYIPLFSSAALIHKAQAIPQVLPLDLTNLLSYLFSTSTVKQLIALLFEFRVPV